MEESRTAPARAILYYTVFGVDGLLALRADVPSGALLGYLRSFGDGEALDLVHLACLARGWGALPQTLRQEAPADGILARLENHRSADGGYHAAPSAERGTLYGCFLAWGAYQDLGRELPDAARTARLHRATANGRWRIQQPGRFADRPDRADGRGGHAAPATRPTGAAGTWPVAVGPTGAGGRFSRHARRTVARFAFDRYGAARPGRNAGRFAAGQRTRVSILSIRSGPTAADSTATGATMN